MPNSFLQSVSRCTPTLVALLTWSSIIGWSSTSELPAAEPTRSFLAADSSKGHVYQINERGETEWEFEIGPLHDLHRLPNGNILLQTNWTKIVEVDPKTKQIVWTYDSATANGNAGQRVEVHAFQRLANGNTMIAESGPARILEVTRDGKVANQIALNVKKPHPHRDTRLVRVTEQGTYLVCHEGDGLVREYDRSGKTVWEYEIPLFGQQPRDGHGPEAFGNQCFAALRLPSGNTLISTGNGHRVIEVTPQKEIVWQVTAADLKTTLAWVTTLQVLPSGNIVLVNCHAGEGNPQILEITRDKQIVWTFYDFKRFGNSLTNAVILNVDGKAL